MSLVSWHSVAVLTDLKNRGVGGVFFVVCDGLKGLAASVNTVWPKAIVQTAQGGYTAHPITGQYPPYLVGYGYPGGRGQGPLTVVRALTTLSRSRSCQSRPMTCTPIGRSPLW